MLINSFTSRKEIGGVNELVIPHEKKSKLKGVKGRKSSSGQDSNVSSLLRTCSQKNQYQVGKFDE